VDGWQRPDAGACVSGQHNQRVQSPRVRLLLELNGSISWGLLFKPYGWLLLSLLAIFNDIATSELSKSSPTHLHH
jgi:hypothetical protein